MLHDLPQRVQHLEAMHERTSSELDEHQQMLLALSQAVQKASQEAEAARAAREQYENLGSMLQDALQRLHHVERQVEGLSSGSAHKQQPRSLELPSALPEVANANAKPSDTMPAALRALLGGEPKPEAPAQDRTATSGTGGTPEARLQV